MSERHAPEVTPLNDAAALRWLMEQHAAPCGDPRCDSVYCYVAKRLFVAPSASGTAPDQRVPEDLRHAAERALEWAAKYPLGGDMDAEVAGRVYHLLYWLVDPACGKYRAVTTPTEASSESDALPLSRHRTFCALRNYGATCDCGVTGPLRHGVTIASDAVTDEEVLEALMDNMVGAAVIGTADDVRIARAALLAAFRRLPTGLRSTEKASER